MIMKRILILLSIFCMSLLQGSAQQQSDVQIRQQLGEAAAALHTMQCDFTQTKQLSMLNTKITSGGRMYYQQPGKLRWEYTQPYAYTFILNGNKVLLKNNNRNDVIDVNQNKLFREIAQIMISSVVGNCLSDDRNFKTSISATQKEWVATLLPLRKNMRQLFQKIILHFNRQQKMVSQVELVEKNGDKTIIDLKHIQKNEKISDRLFAVP